MKIFKKLLFLPLLALFAIPFAMQNSFKTVLASFDGDKFEIGNPSGFNPWTIEDEGYISTNNKWDSNFLIFKNQDTSLNIDSRLEYTITTSFQGPSVSTVGEDQWRGIVIYYVDNQNFLEAVCKWSKNDRSYELQELMLHGQINGDFYQTGSAGNWSSTEWHDIWTDGCGIASDETVTLTVSIYPKDSTHDEVSLSATGSNGGVAGGKQTIRSLVSYASNYPENGPKVGLYSHLGDGKSGTVTFNTFEFRNDVNIGKTPYIEESGTRNVCGYVGDSIKLPTFTATNGKFDILSCDVEVDDPNGLPVDVKKNAFIPELPGYYTVCATCVDERYMEFADPIIYKIKVYEKVEIVISQSFSNPTYGVMNKRVYLPNYTVNVDTKMITTVYDENGIEVEISEGNYFIPSFSGVYRINVKANNDFFKIQDINYEIQIYEYDPIENPRNSNLALIIVNTILLSLAFSWAAIGIFWYLKRREYR